MKFRKIYILIIVSVILLVYVGSIIYSVTAFKYETGSTTITPAIQNTGTIITPIYTGYIIIGIPVTIINNGLYSVKDFVLVTTIYADDWQYSTILNGDQVGEGTNTIPLIAAGKQWQGTFEFNITKHIPNFAIEDCSLRIDIQVNLKYQPIITIPFSYNTELLVEYSAPF
ncbi:MAG: hypothetical protein ACTSW1_15080 [Candidatus Hodarchaeales archaeon]